MKVLAIFAICAATVPQAATAEVLFYGGDFDNVNGIISQRDPYADARVYEDFSLSEPSAITGVFGTFADLHNQLPATAYFELRSDIEAGHGGKLIASGEFSVESTYQGGGIGFNFWRFSGNIAAVELAPGVIIGSPWHSSAEALGNLSSPRPAVPTARANLFRTATVFSMASSITRTLSAMIS